MTPSMPIVEGCDHENWRVRHEEFESFVPPPVESSRRRSVNSFSPHLAISPSQPFAPLSPLPIPVSLPPPQLDTQLQVCIRVRPMNSMEVDTGQTVAWAIDTVEDENGKSNHTIRPIQPYVTQQHATPHSSQTNTAPLSFTFDHIFLQHHTNAEIYQQIGLSLIHQVMNGYHACLLAFGMTSSGKTYTIHGAHFDPGMIPLCVQGIFDHIEACTDREYVLRVAYLEVYNEVVNDLLNPLGMNLSIRESTSRGIYVDGLKESVVVSPDQVFALLSSGEAQRHVGKTHYNQLSSRSHTIFQMTIESTDRESTHRPDGTRPPIRSATLNLCDLAGSESSIKAGSTARMKETSYINRSLLTLGHVIYKLSENSNPGKKSKPSSNGPIDTNGSNFIPYRDSKLTRLLQSSLSGVACVSMICTISPSSGNLQETLTTLKFARRSKRIRVAPISNELLDPSSALIRRYRQEIQRLREELRAYKSHAAKAATAGPIQQQANAKTIKSSFHSNDSGEDSDFESYCHTGLDSSTDDSQSGQCGENVLAAQIEQLNRLILTSSQVQRSDETEFDEVTVESKSMADDHHHQTGSSIHANFSDSLGTELLRMNPSVSSPSNSNSVPSLSKSSHDSLAIHQLNESVSARNSAGIVPSSHHASLRSEFNFPSDSANANGVHATFDLSQLPPSANRGFFPTSSNPITSWSRSRLETQYMQLLSAYTNQLTATAGLGDVAHSCTTYPVQSSNRETAMEIPLLQSIDKTLQSTNGDNLLFSPSTNVHLASKPLHEHETPADSPATRLRSIEHQSPSVSMIAAAPPQQLHATSSTPLSMPSSNSTPVQSPTRRIMPRIHLRPDSASKI